MPKYWDDEDGWHDRLHRQSETELKEKTMNANDLNLMAFLLNKLNMTYAEAKKEFLNQAEVKPVCRNIEISQELVEVMTEPMAQLYRVIPINYENETNTLTVAAAIISKSIEEELQTFLGCNIKTEIYTEEEINKALNHYYNLSGCCDCDCCCEPFEFPDCMGREL
ncbi:MAG: hypothetical protein M0R80_08515 [Proteobacteria bacterium]|jgi:hypothetical protein|nr:hypothetical protein [Pseudomonadota bacterium]